MGTAMMSASMQLGRTAGPGRGLGEGLNHPGYCAGSVSRWAGLAMGVTCRKYLESVGVATCRRRR